MANVRWEAKERVDRLVDTMYRHIDVPSSSANAVISESSSKAIVQDYTLREAREALDEASRQIIAAQQRMDRLAEAKRLIKRELLGEDKPTRGA